MTTLPTSTHRLFLIIRREYLTRIRKPSFWILTILIPLLVASLYALPIMLASKPTQQSHLLVVDDSGLFQGQFRSSRTITYHPAGSLDYAKRQLATIDTLDAILFIPAREVSIPQDAFLYYRTDEPPLALQSDVNSQLQEILRNCILLDVHGITPDDYALLTGTRVHLRIQDIETGRDSFLTVKLVLGFFLAILLFLAVILFGSQVMRGVMEEKSSRIVEVIISSVRPFQLMMGKVLGIGLLGITQFLLWVALSGVALSTLRIANAPLLQQARTPQITELATKGGEATARYQAAQQEAVAYDAGFGIDHGLQQILQGIDSINVAPILFLFLFYFLFGYLLYAALFAAAGSLVDTDTDSAPFLLPITAPLLLSLLLLPIMVAQPSGTLATVLSVIPFTAPVAMLFRIPFGVPIWQLIISMLLLLLTFPLATALAARIYRTAILRHGQKPLGALRQALARRQHPRKIGRLED